MLLSLLVLEITIVPSSCNCLLSSRIEFWTGDRSLIHLVGLSPIFSSEEKELDSLILESALLSEHEGDLSGESIANN